MTRGKSSRPKPFRVGPVRVRAIRGPKGDRHYWRAEIADGKHSRTVLSAWGTEAEITREVAAIIAADRLDAPKPGDTLSTVQDLMETWIAEQDERVKRGDIRARTLVLYERDARRLVDGMGDTPIRRTGISLGAIERCRDRKLAKGVSRILTARALARLRTAWIWARRHDLVPPVDLPVVEVRVKETVRYTPSTGDVLRTAAALNGWQRLALLTLFHTGMRIGELGELKWEDVDLERGVLVVRGGKTGDREVPLSVDLKSLLRPARRESGRVLGVRPRTVRSLCPSHARPICERLKIRPFTAHGVRRLMVDNLLRAGVDVATAASITGHSAAVLLKYYRQVSADDRANAIARLAILTGGSNVVAFPSEG